MDNIDERKAERLLTIKKNQLKLVRRRGYDIKKEEPLFGYDVDDFLNVYVPFSKKNNKSLKAILSQVYEKENGKRLYIFYADEPSSSQLGVKYIYEFIEEMDKFKSRNGILITPVKLSPASNKELAKLLNYNVQVFLDDEMMYDPTEHFLVPEHRALGEEEQRDFLKRNNLSLNQFQIMLTTDMISRYYGFRPGELIEIKRTNLYDTMVPESLAYRVVEEDEDNI
jgi:DNA-directed RNA polymerase I, II, and III subunit RPABC1